MEGRESTHLVDQDECEAIEALTRTGRASWAKGDSDAALEAFFQALQRAEKVDDERKQGLRTSCSFNAGTCLLGLGKTKESIPLLIQVC